MEETGIMDGRKQNRAYDDTVFSEEEEDEENEDEDKSVDFDENGILSDEEEEVTSRQSDESSSSSELVSLDDISGTKSLPIELDRKLKITSDSPNRIKLSRKVLLVGKQADQIESDVRKCVEMMLNRIVAAEQQENVAEKLPIDVLDEIVMPIVGLKSSNPPTSNLNSVFKFSQNAIGFLKVRYENFHT